MHVGLIIHMFTYVRDNKPDKNERNNWTKLRFFIANWKWKTFYWNFISMYHEFLLSEISVHESYKGGLKVGNFFCKWFLVWPLRWNHTKHIKYCFVLWQDCFEDSRDQNKNNWLLCCGNRNTLFMYSTTLYIEVVFALIFFSGCKTSMRWF